MKIGIFSTFTGIDALTLVKAVEKAIKSGAISDSQIAFIFSNREVGESSTTDKILSKLSNRSIPLITFSAAKFKPDLKRKVRKEEQKGNNSLMDEWRNLYGAQVLKKIPPTDLDLLLGDMWIWGKNMCEKRNGINLHPALPTGPKGEWYRVIWELIEERKNETGVMMHKITPELDRGPVVSYCSFKIVGDEFDPLWKKLPQKKEDLQKLIKKGISEKGKTQYPLHKKIRKNGFMREIPLIIETTKAFANGSIKVKGKSIFDKKGKKLTAGYDLTKQVNKEISI